MVSITALVKPNSLQIGYSPVEKELATTGEIFDAAYEDFKRSGQFFSKETNYAEALDERNSKLRSIMGDDKFNSVAQAGIDQITDAGAEQRLRRYNENLDVYIANNGLDVPTYAQVTELAMGKAKSARAALDDVNSRPAPDAWTRTANIGGAIAASFSDPVTLASMVTPFGEASLGRAIVRGAAEGAGWETLTQGSVFEYQQELGQKYGAGDAAQNIIWATALSGAVPVIAKGISTTAATVAEFRGFTPEQVRMLRLWEKDVHLSETPVKRTEEVAIAHEANLKKTAESLSEGRGIPSPAELIDIAPKFEGRVGYEHVEVIRKADLEGLKTGTNAFDKFARKEFLAQIDKELKIAMDAAPIGASQKWGTPGQILGKIDDAKKELEYAQKSDFLEEARAKLAADGVVVRSVEQLKPVQRSLKKQADAAARRKIDILNDRHERLTASNQAVIDANRLDMTQIPDRFKARYTEYKKALKQIDAEYPRTVQVTQKQTEMPPEQYLEELQKPEVMASVRKELSALAVDKPQFKIGGKNIIDLMDTIKDQEKIDKLIASCAT